MSTFIPKNLYNKKRKNEMILKANGPFSSHTYTYKHIIHHKSDVIKLCLNVSEIAVFKR